MQENTALFEFDAQIAAQGYPLVCGVDEAGRGPLAGPVVAAAVILPPQEQLLERWPQLAQLNDSKKLSEKMRELLYPQIIEKALAYKVVMVGPQTIDELNILNATLLGMRQAVEGLAVRPGLALIDGNRCPEMEIPAQSVVKGDARSASISAASILAKVSRDRYMEQLAKEYPQYQLEKHKGYPTKLHYALLDEYGIQPFYRRSFLKKRGYV